MTSENIVDNRLYIQLDLTPTYLINQAFSQDTSSKAHFASQLLLYDTIVIPTLDFGIVPSLVQWLGLERFNAAIKSNSVRFIRRVGFLAYSGNGNGICNIIIERGSDPAWEWWKEALFSNDEASLEIQLDKLCPSISHRQLNILARDISSNAIHLSYDNDFFIENIAKESYRDIINSPLLSQIAQNLNRNKSRINLEWLVDANKTRILSSDRAIKDAVDLVLSVAEINIQILMAIQACNADLQTLQGVEKLLTEKLRYINIEEPLLDKFIKFLDLNSIPDIRPAIANGSISFAKIWEIRESKDGQKFREWLRNNNPDDVRSIERAYVEILGKDTLVDALPIRALRFVLTTAFGILNPIIGAGAGILDSFFVDRWLKGYSPKLFLDDLRKLQIARK